MIKYGQGHCTFEVSQNKDGSVDFEVEDSREQYVYFVTLSPNEVVALIEHLGKLG